MRPLFFVIGLASSLAAAEPPSRPTATSVTMAVHRAADGKKYPVPVAEMYELSSNGTLRYSAYFENMPIDMNHNDSIEWGAGGDGKHVLAAAQAVLAKLPVWTDGTPQPGGGRDVYFVRVATKAGDTTRYAQDPKSPGWRRIDPAFLTMIRRFEVATGLPGMRATMRRRNDMGHKRQRVQAGRWVIKGARQPLSSIEVVSC